MKSSRIPLLITLVVLALGTTVYISVRQFPGSPARVLKEKEGHGKAAIGGAFELTTPDNKTFTQDDLLGKWSLVYFGYTFCPDICPMALDNISKGLNKLTPALQGQFQPIFITIDPKRDTQAELGKFIKNFHPRWVALSGTEAQINQAAKAYKVYSAVAEDENKGTPYYLMDHSSLVYVMNPEGEYVTHFTHQTPPNEVAGILRTVTGRG